MISVREQSLKVLQQRKSILDQKFSKFGVQENANSPGKRNSMLREKSKSQFWEEAGQEGA